MVLAVAAVIGGVGGVDVAGGAHLSADHLLAQVVHGDVGALLDDNHLYAGGVGVGKVHLGQTVLADGDAGHGDVALAVLNGQQGGVKAHVVHHQLQAQLVGDSLGHLYVNADGIAGVVQHLIGRELGVGGHMQLAGLYGGEAAALLSGDSPAAGAAAPAAEEKTEFDVVLAGFDAAAKIKVIKVVREITGLGLAEAKAAVEGTPKTLKEGLSKDEAEEMKKKVEEAGGKVELK